MTAWQLEHDVVDSVKPESIHVLISRMVKKGILMAEEKHWYRGQTRKFYVETTLGKELDV